MPARTAAGVERAGGRRCASASALTRSDPNLLNATRLAWNDQGGGVHHPGRGP